MSKPLRSKKVDRESPQAEKLFKLISGLVTQNLRLREYALTLDKKLVEASPASYAKALRILTRVESDRSGLNRQLNQYGINIR